MLETASASKYMETIRKSTLADAERIDEIYAGAKKFMHSHGNPEQWNAEYPNILNAKSDVENGIGYVMEEDGKVFAAFAFIIGPDPTYTVIEDGAWPSEEPYGTIHRIASDGSHSGVMKLASEFCSTLIKNVRIDTHKDNSYMLNALKLLDFTRCGIIHLENGDPRIAFQKSFE